ncbi:MAG: cytochrome c oxidase assembly protein, partial [Pseudomonadota bacterium]
MDKNLRTALVAGAAALGMVGMSFAAVPLYQVFCQVTGFGGTTQRADAGADRVLKREMTIRFDASTHRDLPWRFKPQQVAQTLKIGETGLAFYEATNLSSEPIVGTATCCGLKRQGRSRCVEASKRI